MSGIFLFYSKINFKKMLISIIKNLIETAVPAATKLPSAIAVLLTTLGGAAYLSKRQLRKTRRQLIWQMLKLSLRKTFHRRNYFKRSNDGLYNLGYILLVVFLLWLILASPVWVKILFLGLLVLGLIYEIYLLIRKKM